VPAAQSLRNLCAKGPIKRADNMTPKPATKKYLGAKVLVTGADGFIGSHLTEALGSAGAEVTALAQYNSFDSHGWLDDLPEPLRRQILVVRGDVRDAAFVGRLVPGHEIVFHLAALIAIPHSYAAPQSYIETNVLGTLHVLEAARQHGTERIVHTSTSEVYGTALKMPIDESHPLQGQSPYSASKIAADMMAEAYARSFGVPVVILRPFNTFGPRQSERAIIASIIRQALDPSCPAIMVGDATTVRDLTFVTDTAAAFMAAGRSADGIEFGQAYCRQRARDRDSRSDRSHRRSFVERKAGAAGRETSTAGKFGSAGATRRLHQLRKNNGVVTASANAAWAGTNR